MMTLSQDGRYSYAKLSKKLGLEKITVAKRIEKLLKDGVIAIRAIPNPMKMGYKIMACIALNVEMAMLDSVCDSLVDIPNISLVSTIFGKYDVILFAEYREIDMLDRLVREQIPNMKGVKTVETFIITEEKNKHHGPYHIDASNEKGVLIDEIDEKLINELRLNGRMRFAVIADKLNISPATVSRRVSALIKTNIIRISLLVNPIKLGHSFLAYLGLQTELLKTTQIGSQLFNYPQVSSVITLMNGYNILAIVIVPDLQSLSNFIKNEVATIDGILNIETFVRSEFKKGTYLKFNLEGMLYSSFARNSDAITE
jgi:Lrp/AsnC family transcriptional regulator, regulator for asnA, asnC and gidA